MVPVVEAEGDAVRGEEVFRRADLSCLKCHAVSKAGGQVGPDLSAVGASSPIDYLLHSISDPDQQIKEAYITRVVVTDEGQVLQGVVANRTDDTLVLRDAAGNLVSIPNDSIEEEIEGKSLMPKGLMKFMTEEELLDLVKFLSMLGKPGTEYAIRSTPRMQRWRVLTGVPAEYVDEVPDFTAFEDHIYRSGDAQPVYARVNGDVPLEEVTTRLQQPVVYLVGEVEVTQPGPIGVRLDAAEGVTMWVDKHLAQDAEAVVELPAGRHPITLRIDTRQRESDTVKLELFRPAGSKAEFAVVDGA
jgi:putative heme-binding domain-containing protein